jgi:hypothetical protein
LRPLERALDLLRGELSEVLELDWQKLGFRSVQLRESTSTLCGNRFSQFERKRLMGIDYSTCMGCKGSSVRITSSRPTKIN